MQTKKITQNVGRSILVPDFWVWRPAVDIPQPRFREGAGGEVSRESKIWPKMAFFGPGRPWRPLILHVLGPRWRLGSPALRLPPQASQGPTAPTQPRTCTYMYIAWHARYGRAFEPCIGAAHCGAPPCAAFRLHSVHSANCYQLIIICEKCS